MSRTHQSMFEQLQASEAARKEADEMSLRSLSLAREALRQSEAARLKAEGERDEARRKMLAWIKAREASEARVREVEEELRQAYARIRKWEDHEVRKASCCVDNQQRAEEAEARLREVEQERDEAVERADIAEAKWCGIEARLRAVIEAADMLVNCAEAHEAHAWHETYRCKEGVCICGPKKMQAHLDDALAAYRRVRDASPEPEASHKFEPIVASLTSICAVCSLPWSKHGGRDGE